MRTGGCGPGCACGRSVTRWRRRGGRRGGKRESCCEIRASHGGLQNGWLDLVWTVGSARVGNRKSVSNERNRRLFADHSVLENAIPLFFFFPFIL